MLSPSMIERLVQAATLAPSSHNTQPWRFTALGGAVGLRADRARALPVNDPHDRELTISCGCALGNLEHAAQALGLEPVVDTFPDDADPDLLARLRAAAAGAVDAALPPSIVRRHTWRGEVAADEPSMPLRARLQAAAALHGVTLHVLEGETRMRAATLVERGDRAQWDDPRWRRELALWMHPPRAGDGLVVPAPVAPATRAVVRAVDLGRVVGPRDADSVREAPWLGLLATHDDDPAAWLATGRALQAMLLAAVDDGFQAAYFNQPVQVDALRPMLAALCPGDLPQVLFRLGRPAAACTATPRRGPADVLDLPERAS